MAHCFVQPLTFSHSRTTVTTNVCKRPPTSFITTRITHSFLSFTNTSIIERIERKSFSTNHDQFHYYIQPTMKEESNTNNGIRIVAGALIGGLIVSSLLPLTSAIKNGITGGDKTLIEEKLSRVPVFTVTDSTGRPYMSETEDGRLRLGYFFVQPSDADDFLKKVMDTNEMKDAKILAVGMNDVIQFLDAPASITRPGKGVPERFELFPDDHELQLAQQLSEGRFKKTYGLNGVPVFYIEGLAFRDEKSGGNVIPIFFEKEKLDEAIDNLKKADPNAEVKDQDVQILDFLQTVREIRAGADNRLNRVVFIPMSDALNKLNIMNSQKSVAAST